MGFPISFSRVTGVEGWLMVMRRSKNGGRQWWWLLAESEKENRGLVSNGKKTRLRERGRELHRDEGAVLFFFLFLLTKLYVKTVLLGVPLRVQAAVVAEKAAKSIADLNIAEDSESSKGEPEEEESASDKETQGEETEDDKLRKSAYGFDFINGSVKKIVVAMKLIDLKFYVFFISQQNSNKREYTEQTAGKFKFCFLCSMYLEDTQVTQRNITYDVNPSFVLMDIDGLRVVVYVYELIDGEVKVDKIDFKKTTAPTHSAH
ncbi:hypothetical protein DKX38_022312 [Salix brachista]|uniref:Uncharacterized protein n=1 Tax=Salix brachista TaxID=2182728 RepID=A0A5N5K404_9ROSI|nr:hypothetical protein DKX38_022312 [Salix brachista]